MSVGLADEAKISGNVRRDMYEVTTETGSRATIGPGAHGRAARLCIADDKKGKMVLQQNSRENIYSINIVDYSL